MADKGLTKNRLFHIEVLRIVACVFVLYIHTGIYGFALFGETDSAPLRWGYLCLSILSKAAVPLFFAMSGRCCSAKMSRSVWCIKSEWRNLR